MMSEGNVPKDYVPAPESKGNAGKAVLPNGDLAGQCLVRFKCPECNKTTVRNAYEGVVICLGEDPKYAYEFQFLWFKVWMRGTPHRPAITEPQELIK